MTAAKGAVLSLLIDAYQKRDRVGLVAFKGNKAEVLFHPPQVIKSLVIDAEQSFIGLGLAREISQELGAKYLRLEELRAEEIVGGIREIGM